MADIKSEHDFVGTCMHQTSAVLHQRNMKAVIWN